MVIGCDGIWDCVSSKECIEFVGPRLEKGDDLTSISAELMDTKCLAEFIEYANGGNDNMTFMIIVFKH